MTTIHFRELLQRELKQRIALNPQYSMRAFARALQIDPADLCRILSGKGNPSIRTAVKITEQLALSSEESQQFIDSIVREQVDRARKSVSHNHSVRENESTR